MSTRRHLVLCCSLAACVTLLALPVAHAAPAGQELSSSTARRVGRLGLRLPIVRQAKTYSCGAASLMSVLQYFQTYAGREENLYRKLKTTPREGTHPDRLVALAQERGLKAQLREGLTVPELRRAVRQNKAVILDLQAWRAKEDKHTPWQDLWNSGHYVVLKAVGSKYIYFMDPAAGPGYGYLPIKEFQARWHDRTIEAGPLKKTVRTWRQAGIIIEGPPPPKSPPLYRLE